MLNDLFTKTDALLIAGDSNRFYFTNLHTSFGYAVLTPTAKYLFTDFRYAIVARQKVVGFEIVITDGTNVYADIAAVLAKKGVRTIGYEDGYWSVSGFKALKKALGGFEFKAMGAEITALRVVKMPEEIDRIKRAQALTEAALTKTLTFLKTGVTEREISAELTYNFLMMGADGLAFDNIVSFGENSADCHHTPGDRKLEKGDIVLFDIGAKLGGYCSDMTRTFFFGEPSQKFVDLYKLVLAAQNYVLKFIKEGVTGKEADSMAREFFKANGYEKEFGHSLGHGVGIDIHEEPRLARTNEEPLPANCIVTVEPGLYIEDLGGVRIEDMVVIKKDGIENLTNYNKNFII